MGVGAVPLTWPRLGIVKAGAGQSGVGTALCCTHFRLGTSNSTLLCWSCDQVGGGVAPLVLCSSSLPRPRLGFKYQGGLFFLGWNAAEESCAVTQQNENNFFNLQKSQMSALKEKSLLVNQKGSPDLFSYKPYYMAVPCNCLLETSLLRYLLGCSRACRAMRYRGRVLSIPCPMASWKETHWAHSYSCLQSRDTRRHQPGQLGHLAPTRWLLL